MIRRMLNFVNDNKLLTMITASFVVLTIPLIVICFYGSPTLDDFVHSAKVKDSLPVGYNIFEYFGTVASYSSSIYERLQGAYSINALIALNPMVYNIYLIPAFYIANFLFFIFANYVFSNTISRKVLNSNKKTSLLLASTILIITLQFIPLAESFYWYAGIVGYTLPYSLSLLFISNLIMIYIAKKPRLHTLFGIVLGFILGGTNFPLGLFLSVVSLLALIISYLYQRKIIFNLLLISSSLLVGFLINILAVGNSNRMALGFEMMSPLKAVLLSFWGFTINFSHILAYSTIIFFIILLLPKMAKILEKINYSFKAPLVVSFASLCASGALFTPAFYAGIGEVIPNRYNNVSLSIIIWLILINAFYWLGWALKNNKISINFQKQGLILVVVAFISLQVPLSNPKLDNISFIRASREITTGIAASYKSEVDMLYAELANSPNQDVVYRINTQSSVLQKIVIAEDENFWANRMLARFFGAKSIRSGD